VEILEIIEAITCLNQALWNTIKKGSLFFKKIQNNENEGYFSNKLVITPDGNISLTYQSDLVL